MKRGLAGIALVAACLLGVGAAAGGLDGKPKPKPKPKPKTGLAQPPIRLATKDPSVLVLTAPGYRLILAKENGEILELLDRRSGERVLGGQLGCMWAAKQTTGEAASGCGVQPHGRQPLHLPLVAADDDAHHGLRLERRLGRGSMPRSPSWPAAVRSTCGSSSNRTSSTRSPARSSRPTSSCPRTKLAVRTCRRSCRARACSPASSRARTGTSRRTRRAGRSRTISPPTSGRGTLRSTP